MTRAPPLHDPARTPPTAAAETQRRACEAMHIPADHDLDIGV